MDGVHNPSRHANAESNEGRPLVGRFAYLAERRWWTNPYGSTNSSGTNLDSRRLALERAARKGEPHGWGSQSLATRERRVERRAPLVGRFAYLAERRWWTNPYGSTNSSGTNLDSRRLALERAARKGEPHGRGSQSLTTRQRGVERRSPRKGRFAYLAESGGGRTLTVRQIRLERIWTTEGRPRSAQRAGVNPMDGVHNPSRHGNVESNEGRPARGVLRIWRRAVVDEPLRFDKFVWNEFGRPKVGPGARSAQG